MQQYPTDRIRNVALVGHGGVGKTTLAEALLHRAGVTTRAGTIEDGNTITDTEPEEIARRMSISLAIAPFEWQATDGNTYKINLIDTPGYPDFVADVDAALSVADLAIIVTSAVDGIEVGTESAWRKCAALGLPRMIFVTREDKHRADFHAVLARLRSVFGHGCAPLELPLGEEEAFHGVADVLTEEALEYEPDGRHRKEPLPDDIADEEHRLHDELVEEIVSGDDEQLEKYLTGEIPTIAELERTLAHEVLECTEFPVLVGSGHTRRRSRPTRRLHLRARTVAGRSAVEGHRRRQRDRGQRRSRRLNHSPTSSRRSPTSTSARSRCSRSCPARSATTITSSRWRSSTDERMHGLFHLRGSEHMDASRLIAGDIGGVSKLASAATGSTLAPKGKPVRVQRVAAAGRRVRGGAEAGDPIRRRQAVGRAATARVRGPGTRGRVPRRDAPDRAARCRRHPRRRGPRPPRAQVRRARRDRGGSSRVPRDDPRVRPGRGEGEEAVRRARSVRGRHTSASPPLGRGDGFQFVDAVVGGAIPKNYIAAVNKGVEEAAATGGAHGFPVVDVRVECYDGKTHSVDSSDMAFKTAAAQGFREAVTHASPVILEPISLVTVTVPTDLQGDVLSDVSTRRGRIVGSDVDGDGHQIITAHVPTAELQRYAMDLRAMTAGRGTFWSHHDHYDVLPSHLVRR